MATEKPSLPRGTKFFELVAHVESSCITESLAEIPKLGVSAPACLEALGDVLSLLYAEASCFHGCVGGEHFFQRLTARVVTHSLSVLRLILCGYYDEALALTRNVGEIANLLFLFAARPDLLESWRAADDARRKREFGPVKVRLALEKMKLRPPVDESRYGLLSETGVHLVPEVSPQTFNDHGRPTLGAKMQYAGLMCTLNELALAVAECAACVSTFAYVGSRKGSLRSAAENLMNAVGNLDLEATRAVQAGA